MKFDYAKLAREYDRWVTRETGGNANYTPKEIGDIAQRLTTAASEGDCRILGSRLSYLANWHARSGVVRISQGQTAGWLELRKFGDYEFWDDRIRCRSYDRMANKRMAEDFTPTLLNAGKCGIVCMALSDWTEASWMAQRLDQSRSDGSIQPWSWKLAVPHLVIALDRYRTGRTDLNDLETGIYRSVFDSWNDSTGLAKALLDVADYHAANLKDEGNRRYGEFARPPIDIFPAELVAIHRVRESLGLETPAIDHPVVKTPFATPPRDLKPEPDDLLAKVLDKVRTIIPDL